MPEFLSPVDIGNRALQRVGADLMDPTQGFTENSKRAQQVSQCYGKLRQAELQRATWTFATVQTAIRSVDTDTALLTPTLFNATVTYFLGSVVTDQSGSLWESTARDNLGNDPQNTPTAWKPYFGPMTAEPFNSSIPYFIGELVYTISGTGLYNVFKSMLNGNVIHPAMPNLWAFDTKYSKDDVVTVWPAWISITTYSQGQSVQYTDGNIYTSLTNSNLNNIPAALGANWVLMPTLTLISQQYPIGTSPPPAQAPTVTPIDEWGIDTTYSLGQFAIYNAAIYVSIANNNTSNNPATPSSAFWALTTGAVSYQSLIDFNQNNNPASAPALWGAGVTYSSGQKVGASNGLIYTSTTNGNIGHDPTLDSGANWTNTHVPNPWTTVFVLGGGNRQWIQIGGSAFPNGVGLEAFRLTYPVGAGPRSQARTKNVYHLPGNWLRKAPQDPKAGSYSILGAPANLQQTDWTYQDRFLVTWDLQPIVYRFVADVQDVRRFEPIFCEMLSCSIGLEICEPITQSTAKKQVIAQEYKMRRTEAITVNAIETDAVEPPLDDFIAARM